MFDSIDGAARCAVKVQQKVQQKVPDYDRDQPPARSIRFRVGINVGDVIPDGTDIHGDVVNVAARLQADCPPGDICVSRAVRDHVRDRLDLAFEELGARPPQITMPPILPLRMLKPRLSQPAAAAEQIRRATAVRSH